MFNEKIYITVNHLDDFNTTYMFRIGDILTLRKDHDNCYDDEAIAAYSRHKAKCGYVANSVCSVCRGTYSAGRVYDKIPEEYYCIVRFICEDHLIGELTEEKKEEDNI